MALGSSGVILAVLVGLSYSISTGFAVSQSLADIVDHSPTASTSTGTTESEESGPVPWEPDWLVYRVWHPSKSELKLECTNDTQLNNSAIISQVALPFLSLPRDSLYMLPDIIPARRYDVFRWMLPKIPLSQLEAFLCMSDVDSLLGMFCLARSLYVEYGYRDLVGIQKLFDKNWLRKNVKKGGLRDMESVVELIETYRGVIFTEEISSQLMHTYSSGDGLASKDSGGDSKDLTEGVSNPAETMSNEGLPPPPSFDDASLVSKLLPFLSLPLPELRLLARQNSATLTDPESTLSFLPDTLPLEDLKKLKHPQTTLRVFYLAKAMYNQLYVMSENTMRFYTDNTRAFYYLPGFPESAKQDFADDLPIVLAAMVNYRDILFTPAASELVKGLPKAPKPPAPSPNWSDEEEGDIAYVESEKGSQKAYETTTGAKIGVDSPEAAANVNVLSKPTESQYYDTSVDKNDDYADYPPLDATQALAKELGYDLKPGEKLIGPGPEGEYYVRPSGWPNYTGADKTEELYTTTGWWSHYQHQYYHDAGPPVGLILLAVAGGLLLVFLLSVCVLTLTCCCVNKWDKVREAAGCQRRVKYYRLSSTEDI